VRVAAFNQAAREARSLFDLSRESDAIVVRMGEAENVDPLGHALVAIAKRHGLDLGTPAGRTEAHRLLALSESRLVPRYTSSPPAKTPVTHGEDDGVPDYRHVTPTTDGSKPDAADAVTAMTEPDGEGLRRVAYAFDLDLDDVPQRQQAFCLLLAERRRTVH
jgi:hypothetical protein